METTLTKNNRTYNVGDTMSVPTSNVQFDPTTGYHNMYDDDGNLIMNGGLSLPEAEVVYRRHNPYHPNITPGTLMNTVGIPTVDQTMRMVGGYPDLIYGYLSDSHNPNWYVDRYDEDKAELVRKGLYNTITPRGYTYPRDSDKWSKILQAVDVYAHPEKYQTFDRRFDRNSLRESQYEKYLFNRDSEDIPRSEYRPSISTDPNAVYYKIPDKYIGSKILGSIYRSDEITRKIQQCKDELDYYYDNNASNEIVEKKEDELQELYTAYSNIFAEPDKQVVEGGFMGHYTRGIGKDENGRQYEYYYDKWDMNPFDQFKNKWFYPFLPVPKNGDISGGIGHPFEYYDRKYFDNFK